MKKCSIKFLAVVVTVMVLCSSAWADIAINEANFPDSVFRSYISNAIDKDKNSTLSDSELAVTDMDISGDVT